MASIWQVSMVDLGGLGKGGGCGGGSRRVIIIGWTGGNLCRIEYKSVRTTAYGGVYKLSDPHRVSNNIYYLLKKCFLKISFVYFKNYKSFDLAEYP